MRQYQKSKHLYLPVRTNWKRFLRDISNCLNVVFSRKLASTGKELKDNFLRALAEREEANRSGETTVSTLLQHSICYVMGFPQNISAILLGREHNPHCVTFWRATPPLLSHTLPYCHLSLHSQGGQTMHRHPLPPTTHIHLGQFQLFHFSKTFLFYFSKI